MIEGLLVLVALVSFCIWLYNRLVKDRNQVAAAWSDVDVQLKRRYDLVPQLVSAVKAYADYEQATLAAVTELRQRSRDEPRIAEKAVLEDAIERDLHRLLVVAEDYPELKADQNFRQLMQDLTETEDFLQYARRFYNGAVRIFNTRIHSLPHFLLARSLGLRKAEFIAAQSA